MRDLDHRLVHFMQHGLSQNIEYFNLIVLHVSIKFNPNFILRWIGKNVYCCAAHGFLAQCVYPGGKLQSIQIAANAEISLIRYIYQGVIYKYYGFFWVMYI